MGGSLSVLAVDDEPGYAELIAAKLERAADQLSVTAAAGAEDGLQRLDEATFDGIISDYEMPKMDGIEFLRAVRSRDQTIPFILFTAQGSEEVASDAIASGVTDYLQKTGQTEDYTLLANRVCNAIEAAQAKRDRVRHRNTIETATEGVSIVDEDGRFEYVNERFAALYGYTAEEMSGEHWSLTHPPAENDRIESQYIPQAKAEGSWHGKVTGLQADGTTFTEDHTILALENRGTICRVQRANDENTTGSQSAGTTTIERLAATVDTGLFAVTPEYDEVVFANEAAAELYGLKLTTARQEPHAWLERVHPDDKAEILASVERQQAGDVTWPVNQEFRIDHPDHGTRWVLTQLRPTRDDEGLVIEINGAVTDITEQKRREQELARERDRLDEFASFISHDLRNPLSVAKGYVEMAKRECDSAALTTVDDSLNRIDELTKDLLTLAREGEAVGETSVVSLASLSQRCWENVTGSDARIETVTDLSIHADPSRLSTLFENLYRNAITHGKPDVTVTVGELDAANGFYVADDGVGIDDAEHDRLFDRGYSTESGGTGFGLAIVKQIAEAHGWDIRARESASGGTRFDVVGVEVVADDRSTAERRV